MILILNVEAWVYILNNSSITGGNILGNCGNV